MPKLITKYQISKIYEAHELGVSTRKASKYAGVSYWTVIKYWNKKGLEKHFEVCGPTIAREKISKIYEAHEEGMSIPKTAKYAGVSESTVWRYWNKKGLEKHF